MRENEINKVYSMLDDEENKTIHQYRLITTGDGINIYPDNERNIYVLNSLIDKILKIYSYASMYINFRHGFLRIH